MKYLVGLLIATFWFVFLYIIFLPQSNAQKNSEPIAGKLWTIQSVDTMKTSRDKARTELNNPEYDKEIEKEVKAIKHLGANYITINTPYDEEFKPYLERWIRIARYNGLKIWFRGNWSNWEGWFGYSKSLSPENHISNTHNFITSNPELFKDGDIFESCPECENAQYWIHPSDDQAFNEFLRKQLHSNKEAFKKINKKVITNIASIDGGRAKESLDLKTIAAYDHLVAIDHHVKTPVVMEEYIKFFGEKKAKVVISEFGAPIPEINSQLSEADQARFVESIFEEFYKAKSIVRGINYFVSSGGTSALLNDDLTPRETYEIVRNYYTPGVVKGKVTNTLGEPLADVIVETDSDNLIQSTRTDKYGKYRISVPPRSIKLLAGAGEYTIEDKFVDIPNSGAEKTVNFTVEPLYPNIIYQSRLFFRSIFN